MKPIQLHPPHIETKQRRRKDELNKEIDKMISKESVSSLKHINYSSRPYEESKGKIDPLDLEFARRIVSHSSKI